MASSFFLNLTNAKISLLDKITSKKHRYGIKEYARYNPYLLVFIIFLNIFMNFLPDYRIGQDLSPNPNFEVAPSPEKKSFCIYLQCSIKTVFAFCKLKQIAFFNYDIY